ncbi:MAG: phosphate ABC transporter permease PstA [Actinobacteria bacterium]|nr:phosphate ABC transporter permease PstA [Actinomycetota bacterium]
MAATDVAPLAGLRTGAARRARLGELAFQGAMLFALLLGLVILLVLIADILTGAVPLFRERGLGFVTAPLSARPAEAGVWQGILGSVQIVVITVLLAFPVGIATAVYLEEYAPSNRFTRFIDVNIRNLAGVPSVVYGLLGLALFVGTLGPDGLANVTNGATVIAGGLTLAVLALPIVIITAAEAIRAVPGSLREGGYGLGATRWQVTRQLTLPNAAPGILTGMILSLSRVIGETAPLIVVGAATGFLAYGDASFVERLYGKYTALPVIVFQWSRQPGREYVDALAPAAILVLLLFTLSANAIAIVLRNRYEKRA